MDEIDLDVRMIGGKWTVYGKIPGREAWKHGRFNDKLKAKKKLTQLHRIYNNADSALSEKDKDDAETALRILKSHNENEDAVGRDIVFAVNWFLKHFRDTSRVLTIGEYCNRFLELRNPATGSSQAVSERTYRNDKYHLGKFSDCFGPKKPTEITDEDLKAFCGSPIAKQESPFVPEGFKGFATERLPYKVVYGLYSWLSNTHRGMERFAVPVFKGMEDSPFSAYKRPREKRNETLIANHGEVSDMMKLAFEKGVLPFFYLGFFLGIRPDGELQKFLTPQYGWKYIDLNRGVLTIPKEIEKTRQRSRDIALRPSAKKWLRFFRDNGIALELPKKGMRARRREVMREVLDEKRARHPDLMRHTCISHRCKVDKFMHEICRECATSEEIIRDHYHVLVTESEARAFFRIGPEILAEPSQA